MNLIDGDPLCYIAALHAEKGKYTIQNYIQSRIDTICRISGVESCLFFLSDSRNFRREKYPHYKAGRAESPKLLAEARTFMNDTCKTFVLPGLEADDVINMVAKSVAGCTIVHDDKDLNQIPGRHLRMRDGVLYEVSDEEAALFVYKQMLVGDSSDNIKGVPGIGKVKASGYVKNLDSAPTNVKRLYKEAFGKDWIRELRTNYELLTLCDTPLDEEGTAIFNQIVGFIAGYRFAA